MKIQKQLFLPIILLLTMCFVLSGESIDYSNQELTLSVRDRNLAGSDFSGSIVKGNFYNTNLSNANLSGAKFSVELGHANLIGANLTNASFTGSWFDSKTKWPEGFDYLNSGANGPGVDYSNREFNLSARSRDLTGANFSHSTVTRKNFYSANLSNANLRGANFSGSDLGHANLTGAEVADANFTGSWFNSVTKWPEGFDYLNSGANGPGVDYSNREVNLSARSKDLTGANFSNSTVTRKNFVRANLSNANLQGANFSGSDLGHANLTGAEVADANFTGSWFNSVTKWPEGFDYLNSGANGPGVDYSNREFILSARSRYLAGANFSNSTVTRKNFVRANLSNANLQGANFSGSDLGHANLTGAEVADANFTGSWFNSVTKWPEGFDYLNSGANGPGVDYSNREVNLNAYSKDLTGANFSNSTVTRKNFVRANLSNANLQGANFSGSDLGHANLTGAEVADANFTGSWFNSVTKWPEGFDYLNSGANGPGVDYSNRELNLGAYYKDLKGANFSNSIVKGNFYRAKLTDANLQGADFSGVDLTHTTLNGATYTIFTKWRAGFDPVAKGAILVDSSYGLLAWYPFDGNALDMSGNGHHGTVFGATLTDDRNGEHGKAYLFDGRDDFIDFWEQSRLQLVPPYRWRLGQVEWQ